MRYFKSKVLSACAWALPVLSAALPQGRQPEVVRPDGKLLDLDLNETYAQATFSVPCAGCVGQDHTSNDDESIVLSFRTTANNQPCGTSNLTLNGAYLPSEWNGDFASGSGSYTGVTDLQENAWFLQHDLDLEWESACLHGEQEGDDAAQVLTVNIKAIDGKPLATPSGFTISFKQSSPPELLRLESTPNRSASKKDQAELWRNPPTYLRLLLSVPEEFKNADGSTPPSLEDDIRELRALQAEVHELQKAIKAKQHHINSQVKKEAQSFKEELQQCDSLTCVVKTIAHGANGAWKMLYVHFRSHHHHGPHHHGPPPPPPMGRPEDDPYQQVWHTGNHKQVPEGKVNLEAVPTHHPSPPPPPYGLGHPHPPPPPPHHGPHRPHHGPPRIPPPDSPFVIALEIVLGLLCCGCLFTIVRHRCSSPRTRAERAASREERRNAQAYRRAARKLAWRNWWRRNWRDQERIGDYEEKRSLIQHQESILEEAMQEEIRQLRAAHGVVNDIVRAEEGRVACCGPHVHCHCAHSGSPAPYSPLSTASTYPPTSLPELPSRPLSRTDSLPDYRSDASGDPPEYEEEEDLFDTVPNGFRHYTPSTTSSSSSRWTPDSSVIDVSPRPSAETLRYAEMTDTGVGENN